MSVAFTHPDRPTFEITDYELLRNGDGAWLLIVPELPDTLTDNPLSEVSACIEDDRLVIESSVIRLIFGGLISQHYLLALKADRPRELLLCAVNEDGVRKYARAVDFNG